MSLPAPQAVLSHIVRGADSGGQRGPGISILTNIFGDANAWGRRATFETTSAFANEVLINVHMHQASPGITFPFFTIDSLRIHTLEEAECCLDNR